MKLRPSPPAVVIIVGIPIEDVWEERDDLVSSSVAPSAAVSSYSLPSISSFELDCFCGLFV